MGEGRGSQSMIHLFLHASLCICIVRIWGHAMLTMPYGSENCYHCFKYEELL